MPGVRDQYMAGSSMYKTEAKGHEGGGDTAPRQAKLMGELTGLCDRDLPLSLSSTCFVRADEKHTHAMQFATAPPRASDRSPGDCYLGPRNNSLWRFPT